MTPSVVHRCFKITKGPLQSALLRISEERERVLAQWKGVQDDIGATAFFERRGSFCGAQFDKAPDEKVWRRYHEGPARSYLLRKNTADGKAMAARIAALPKVPRMEDALPVVGLADVPMLICGHSAYYPTIFGSDANKTWFVTVPWMETDPKKMKAYLKERAKKTSFDSTLDFLSDWKPGIGMVEIKEWEMLRDIEKLNAKIRAQSAKKGRAKASAGSEAAAA